MTNVIIKDDDGHIIKEFSMIQGIVDNGQYHRDGWTSTIAGIVESGVILIVAEWYNVDEEHALADVRIIDHSDRITEYLNCTISVFD